MNSNDDSPKRTATVPVPNTVPNATPGGGERVEVKPAPAPLAEQTEHDPNVPAAQGTPGNPAGASQRPPRR